MSKSSEEGAAGGAGNPSSPQDTAAGNVPQKDANGNIYEDRAGTKKIIRVVTVMAYVFSVSFAAILLSAYYVFLWEPPNPRLQRHPLSSDPQADYLIDNTQAISNLNNLSNDTDGRSVPATEFDNPVKKLEIFKRIMSSDREATRSYHQKLFMLPEKLLAYEDFVKSEDQPATKPEDSLSDAIAPKSRMIDELSKPTATSGSTPTTLPIFFKAYTPPSPGTLTVDKAEDKIVEKKLAYGNRVGGDLSFEKNVPSLSDNGIIIGLLEGSNIRTGFSNEYGNESNNSTRPAPETMNDETASVEPSELNTTSVMSTGNIGGTVYSEIDDHSYTKTLGDTLLNNKVTIGTDVTTETPTSQIPGLMLPEVDENFQMSLQRHDESRLSKNSMDEVFPTMIPEVQIYPAENAKDILENRK